jgi:hypothetical protein
MRKSVAFADPIAKLGIFAMVSDLMKVVTFRSGEEHK